jgi:Activator of Hsp90 ATPase homolog 1-like protein
VTAPEPLRFTVDVSCPVEHAFRVWTAGIGTWWPADHTVTGEPSAAVVLEPTVGGRIYERTEDGAEHEWGEVTVWDPPGRLGYLWHLRADRSDATAVSIRFLPTEQGTRVEIEHAGWERLGARGHTWRERNHQGWSTLLPYFRAAVAS